MRFLLRCTLLLVACPSLAAAQTLDDLTRKANSVNELALRTETWLSYLWSQDQYVTWITVLLLVLGATATFFAAFTNQQKTKWITAAITAVVTILAGIKTQVLHADDES